MFGTPVRSRFRGRRGLCSAAVLLALLVAGCGEGMSGRYEEVSGLGSLEFRDDGTVYVTVHDMTVQAEYDVDGDRVIITGTRGSQIYARQGETLVGGLGVKYVKQTSARVAGAPDLATP